MRKTQITLVALLAASVFVVTGCGDDTSTPSDTSPSDTSNPGDTGDQDTGTDTGTGNDTDDNICGSRECGMFGGQDCGTCEVGETCNAAGRCEVPGAAMGSYCGLTTTCNDESPNWDEGECVNRQCDSNNCLATNRNAFVFKDVCTIGCTIYKDDDNNGVEDGDAPLTDCNPDDIVDGPNGNKFRCVNLAASGQSPVGLCLPGTEFDECNSDADCPTDEGCEFGGIGGNFNYRCVAKTQAGEWGEISQMSEACNGNPRDGAVTHCESGLCARFGCVTLCDVPADDATADALCDTTKIYADTGCVANKCAGTETACTDDVDCSSWECADKMDFLGAGIEWRYCWPKDCLTDEQCGAKFYCDLQGWNGELGEDAGWEKGCVAQNPDGVDVGEACDSDPDDGVPGNVCKNDGWCVGGVCSNLCVTDVDCFGEARCIAQESTGDVSDSQDGIDDIALPLSFCTVFEDVAVPETSCVADAQCGDGEYCSWYAFEDVTDADAPMQLSGLCTTIDDASFPGETGDVGMACEGPSDCKTGLCFSGYCSMTCNATTECGTFTAGEDTAHGICTSLLYAYGGQIDDPTVNVYIGICQYFGGNGFADCATDLTCASDTEICQPFMKMTDPTRAAAPELLCIEVAETAAEMPDGPLGTACDLDAETYECASGLCLDDGDGDTTGYCSELCSGTVDNCAGASLECLSVTTVPRKGAYVANSGSFDACVLNPVGQDCDFDYDCDGDYVCSNQKCAAAP